MCSKSKSIIKDFFDNIDRTHSYILLLILILGTFGVTFISMHSADRVYVYEDVGSDTIMSYLPTYSYISEGIKNGDLDIWSSEFGIGNTLYSKSACFAEPLLLIFLFFTALVGVGHITVMLVFYKLTVIILTAFLCHKFLQFFSDKYYLISIASFIYAFNGFEIIWGQHYFFSAYNLYLIAVFYCIEKILREKKGFIFLYISVFFSMFYTVYMTYMILLTAGIYALIRYFQLNEHFSAKKFFSLFGRILLITVLGMTSSAIVSLPGTLALINSGRVTNDTSFLSTIITYAGQWQSPGEILPLLQRFFSGNLTGIGSNYGYMPGVLNYYEAPQLFFSIFFFVALFPYFHSVIRSGRRRIITVSISTVLVVLLLTNNAFKFIMYGLSTISNRYTFVLFPVLAIVILKGFEVIFYEYNSKIINWIVFFGGVIFSGFVLCGNWIDSSLNDATKNYVTEGFRGLKVSNYYMFFLGAVLFSIVIAINNEKYKKIITYILAVIVFLNVSNEFFFSTNRDGAVKKEKISMIYSDNDTKKALDYLRSVDDSFYRVDKTYYDCSSQTDSLIYDYCSVSDYNSVLSQDIKDYFTYYMNPRYTYNTILEPAYISSRNDITAYSNMGLRYILSRSKLQDQDHYTKIKKIGDVIIYRNNYENSFVTFYDKAVKKSEFMQYEYPERNKLITDSVIINDEDSGDFDNILINADDSLAEFDELDITAQCEITDLTQNENGMTSMVININNEYVKENGGDLYIDIGYLAFSIQDICLYTDTGKGINKKNPYIISVKDSNLNHMRYLLPRNTKRILFKTDGDGFYLNDYKISLSGKKYRSAEKIADVKKADDGIIKGTVNCASDGFMLIPITYDEDINVYVDEEPVKVYKADSGLTGVKLQKGNHSFVVRYNNSMMKLGAIISLISVLLFTGYVLIDKKMNR